MTTSAPIPPHEFKIKAEAQSDGSYLIKDNTGWSGVATSKVFAEALIERRRIRVGQIEL